MQKKFIIPIIFAGILIIAYVAVFLIPDHVNKFALIAEKVYSGELWRFLTYPFTHLNLSHLVQNIIGLAIVTMLVLELKIPFSDFSITYFITGFFAALPLWMIINFVALGASAAIFGAFGFASMKFKEFNIKPIYVILALTAAIFSSFFLNLSVPNSQNLLQALAHFSGLAAGIGLFFLMSDAKLIINAKKRYCLRSAE